MTKSTSKLFENEEPKPMQEDAMNTPVEEKEVEESVPEKKAEVVKMPSATDDDIQDINLSAIKKKRFRINGDSNKILELNTSDMNIASRLAIAYERLQTYMEDVSKVLGEVPEETDDISKEQETLATTELAKIDAKMKQEIDYIFDAPVSEVCSDGGSMYDPFEGMFRFEHIIDALSKLYENNLNSEFNKMKRRVSAKTSKYTKKYHN